MLRSLRGSPADGLPDISPAGSMVSGRHEIGESKEGKRVLALWSFVREFVSAASTRASTI